ncbi:hypothetical protein BCR35DRAFT_330168 [Leucosporidium creatinivorum]|uniref:Uncharacterized protein n=1 Tax=Leucosporidium creatinivorum TaxID=106004 RepID=A0A1Y2FW83_9BASI|nr:hypothetical protein BCR35DRAFT_330168 [Leucosporidium creatinivorum]
MHHNFPSHRGAYQPAARRETHTVAAHRLFTLGVPTLQRLRSRSRSPGPKLRWFGEGGILPVKFSFIEERKKKRRELREHAAEIERRIERRRNMTPAEKQAERDADDRLLEQLEREIEAEKKADSAEIHRLSMEIKEEQRRDSDLLKRLEQEIEEAKLKGTLKRSDRSWASVELDKLQKEMDEEKARGKEKLTFLRRATLEAQKESKETIGTLERARSALERWMKGSKG